mmetsp:Transcript_121176/g.387060  ORF Transcript_121176/g.387060 Transcript_121176/m.387060 type:complete len:224 (+) Transcript_121176:458-1129(+)
MAVNALNTTHLDANVDVVIPPEDLNAEAVGELGIHRHRGIRAPPLHVGVNEIVPLGVDDVAEVRLIDRAGGLKDGLTVPRDHAADLGTHLEGVPLQERAPHRDAVRRGLPVRVRCRCVKGLHGNLRRLDNPDHTLIEEVSRVAAIESHDVRIAPELAGADRGRRRRGRRRRRRSGAGRWWCGRPRVARRVQARRRRRRLDLHKRLQRRGAATEAIRVAAILPP